MGGPCNWHGNALKNKHQSSLYDRDDHDLQNPGLCLCSFHCSSHRQKFHSWGAKVRRVWECQIYDIWSKTFNYGFNFWKKIEIITWDVYVKYMKLLNRVRHLPSPRTDPFIHQLGQVLYFWTWTTPMAGCEGSFLWWCVLKRCQDPGTRNIKVTYKLL